MTSASPGIVASAMENRFYATREEYVRAVAGALGTEYRFIVDRGLLLQIDAPDLAMERHTLFADAPLAEFLGWVELVIDAINHALAGIDPGSVRLHVCWGNYEGPHTHDVALAEILPLLYDANVGALVLSMANARHAHEHACFERHPLPDHMALVVGVIDTTSNYVEHEEVVADRIERGRAGDRRSPPRDRDHRLRVRHISRHRRCRAVRRVGEAARACRPAPTSRPTACSEGYRRRALRTGIALASRRRSPVFTDPRRRCGCHQPSSAVAGLDRCRSRIASGSRAIALVRVQRGANVATTRRVCGSVTGITAWARPASSQPEANASSTTDNASWRAPGSARPTSCPEWY